MYKPGNTTLGEVLESCMQIIDNMNGQIDKSLPRTSAEDVAFDIHEVIIEEDDYVEV